MISPRRLCCNDSIQIYTSALHQSEHIISQSLPLLDPVSLKRIKLPCRAFDCHHLQCFDFTVMSSLKKDKSSERSFFRCPVCDELRNPEKIYVDFVVLGLLKMYNTSESVKIFRNGSFQATEEISSEFEANTLHSIFDMKQLCLHKYFQEPTITLKQLYNASVPDIVHVINKTTNQDLFSIITLRSKPNSQKDVILLNALQKLRPFHASTWLGLEEIFQGISGVGIKKSTKIIADLTKEYESKTKRHYESIMCGPLTIEDNRKMISDTSVYEQVTRSVEVVDMTFDDEDDDDLTKESELCYQPDCSIHISDSVEAINSAPPSSSSTVSITPSPITPSSSALTCASISTTSSSPSSAASSSSSSSSISSNVDIPLRNRNFSSRNNNINNNDRGLNRSRNDSNSHSHNTNNNSNSNNNRFNNSTSNNYRGNDRTGTNDHFVIPNPNNSTISNSVLNVISNANNFVRSSYNNRNNQSNEKNYNDINKNHSGNSNNGNNNNGSNNNHNGNKSNYNSTNNGTYNSNNNGNHNDTINHDIRNNHGSSNSLSSSSSSSSSSTYHSAHTSHKEGESRVMQRTFFTATNNDPPPLSLIANPTPLITPYNGNHSTLNNVLQPPANRAPHFIPRVAQRPVQFVVHMGTTSEFSSQNEDYPTNECTTISTAVSTADDARTISEEILSTMPYAASIMTPTATIGNGATSKEGGEKEGGNTREPARLGGSLLEPLGPHIPTHIEKTTTDTVASEQAQAQNKADTVFRNSGENAANSHSESIAPKELNNDTTRPSIQVARNLMLTDCEVSMISSNDSDKIKNTNNNSDGSDNDVEKKNSRISLESSKLVSETDLLVDLLGKFPSLHKKYALFDRWLSLEFKTVATQTDETIFKKDKNNKNYDNIMMDTDNTKIIQEVENFNKIRIENINKSNSTESDVVNIDVVEDLNDITSRLIHHPVGYGIVQITEKGSNDVLHVSEMSQNIENRESTQVRESEVEMIVNETVGEDIDTGEIIQSNPVIPSTISPFSPSLFLATSSSYCEPVPSSLILAPSSSDVDYECYPLAPIPISNSSLLPSSLTSSSTISSSFSSSIPEPTSTSSFTAPSSSFPLPSLSPFPALSSTFTYPLPLSSLSEGPFSSSFSASFPSSLASSALSSSSFSDAFPSITQSLLIPNIWSSEIEKFIFDPCSTDINPENLISLASPTEKVDKIIPKKNEEDDSAIVYDDDVPQSRNDNNIDDRMSNNDGDDRKSNDIENLDIDNDVVPDKIDNDTYPIVNNDDDHRNIGVENNSDEDEKNTEDEKKNDDENNSDDEKNTDDEKDTNLEKNIDDEDCNIDYVRAAERTFESQPDESWSMADNDEADDDDINNDDCNNSDNVNSTNNIQESDNDANDSDRNISGDIYNIFSFATTTTATTATTATATTATITTTDTTNVPIPASKDIDKQETKKSQKKRNEDDVVFMINLADNVVRNDVFRTCPPQKLFVAPSSSTTAKVGRKMPVNMKWSAGNIALNLKNVPATFSTACVDKTVAAVAEAILKDSHTDAAVTTNVAVSTDFNVEASTGASDDMAVRSCRSDYSVVAPKNPSAVLSAVSTGVYNSTAAVRSINLIEDVTPNSDINKDSHVLDDDTMCNGCSSNDYDINNYLSSGLVNDLQSRSAKKRQRKARAKAKELNILHGNQEDEGNGNLIHMKRKNLKDHDSIKDKKRKGNKKFYEGEDNRAGSIDMSERSDINKARCAVVPAVVDRRDEIHIEQYWDFDDKIQTPESISSKSLSNISLYSVLGSTREMEITPVITPTLTTSLSIQIATAATAPTADSTPLSVPVPISISAPISSQIPTMSISTPTMIPIAIAPGPTCNSSFPPSSSSSLTHSSSTLPSNKHRPLSKITTSLPSHPTVPSSSSSTTKPRPVQARKSALMHEKISNPTPFTPASSSSSSSSISHPQSLTTTSSPFSRLSMEPEPTTIKNSKKTNNACTKSTAPPLLSNQPILTNSGNVMTQHEALGIHRKSHTQLLPRLSSCPIPPGIATTTATVTVSKNVPLFTTEQTNDIPTNIISSNERASKDVTPKNFPVTPGNVLLSLRALPVALTTSPNKSNLRDTSTPSSSKDNGTPRNVRWIDFEPSSASFGGRPVQGPCEAMMAAIPTSIEKNVYAAMTAMMDINRGRLEERNVSPVTGVASSLMRFDSHVALAEIPTKKVTSNIDSLNNIPLNFHEKGKTDKSLQKIIPDSVPNNVPKNVPVNSNTKETSGPIIVPNNVPTNVPKNAPNNVPKDIPVAALIVPNNFPDNVPNNVPNNVPMNAPNNVPNNAPKNVPKNVSNNVPINIPVNGNTKETARPIIIPNNVPKNVPNNISNNVPRNVSNNVPKSVPVNGNTKETAGPIIVPNKTLNNVPKNVPNNVSDNVSKNVPDNVPVNSNTKEIPEPIISLERKLELISTVKKKSSSALSFIPAECVILDLTNDSDSDHENSFEGGLKEMSIIVNGADTTSANVTTQLMANNATKQKKVAKANKNKLPRDSASILDSDPSSAAVGESNLNSSNTVSQGGKNPCVDRECPPFLHTLTPLPIFLPLSVRATPSLPIPPPPPPPPLPLSALPPSHSSIPLTTAPPPHPHPHPHPHPQPFNDSKKRSHNAAFSTVTSESRKKDKNGNGDSYKSNSNGSHNNMNDRDGHNCNISINKNNNKKTNNEKNCKKSNQNNSDDNSDKSSHQNHRNSSTSSNSNPRSIAPTLSDYQPNPKPHSTSYSNPIFNSKSNSNTNTNFDSRNSSKTNTSHSGSMFLGSLCNRDNPAGSLNQGRGGTSSREASAWGARDGFQSGLLGHGRMMNTLSDNHDNNRSDRNIVDRFSNSFRNNIQSSSSSAAAAAGTIAPRLKDKANFETNMSNSRNKPTTNKEQSLHAHIANDFARD